MKTLLVLVVFHLFILHHLFSQNCENTDNIELIIGGDFETIDITNFNFASEYSPNASLEGEGAFNIGANAPLFHPGFIGTANGGAGNFLVVNGSSVPNQNVWCYTVNNLKPNTTYFFSVYVSTVAGGSPAQLQFFTNNIPLGAPFFAPLETGIWQQFYATWKSENNTSAQICLVNQNTTVGGNDFGLDDFSFSASCDKIKNTGPSPSLGNDTVFCGSTIDFQINSGIENTENINFQWSDGSTEAMIEIDQPGTYVLCVDSGGLACYKSDTLIIQLRQPEPPETADMVICQNQPVPDFEIDHDPQNSVLWYSEIDSPLPLETLPDINVAEVQTTIFYISQMEKIGSVYCESQKSPVSIEVLPSPSSALPMLSEICSGQQLEVGNDQDVNYKYKWSSSESDTSSFVEVTIINNQTTFSDSLFVLQIINKSTGCKVIDSAIVRVHPNPQISFSAPETLCVNSSPATLIGLPEGGVFKGSYITNDIFDPRISGNFSILYSYTNENNCSDSISRIITVTDYGKLALELGKDTNICIGESFTLTANNGVNFQWYPGNYVSKSIVVSPKETSVYSLTAIDSAACLLGKDSIEIVVKPYGNFDLEIGSDTVFCFGNNQKLILTANRGRNYLWLPEGQITQSIEVSPIETTKYFVTAVDSAACLQGTDSIQITIQPYQDVDFNIGNDTSICLGQEIELKVNAGKIFKWSPGGETTENIEVSPGTSTQYAVYTVDSTACITGSDSIMVNVDLPLGEILSYDTVNFCFDDGSTIIQGKSATSYLWNTGEKDQEIEIENAGLYILTAYNGSCFKTDTVTVIEKCNTTLYVPSAFSPNLDGVNDNFEIFGTHLYKFNIKIYNRWGELIFTSDDPTIFWDGTYAGMPISPGTYPWVINYRFKDNASIMSDPVVVHGSVVLIR